eukprot:15362807-Ditylum_brightwellii.AAC.1
MHNIRIAFKVLEDGVKAPVRSKWIPCHMIFDVKFDLTWKAQFVAGGHWNDHPKHVTYSSVVSQERAAWREALSLTLCQEAFGFMATKSDPDAYLKPAVMEDGPGSIWTCWLSSTALKEK